MGRAQLVVAPHVVEEVGRHDDQRLPRQRDVLVGLLEDARARCEVADRQAHSQRERRRLQLRQQLLHLPRANQRF